MRRASYSLLWATVLTSVVLAPAAGALAAAGTTTSAGDQQYLDPLASGTTSATPTSPRAVGTVAVPAVAAPAAPSGSPAQAPVAPTGAANHDPSARTLPYTGFNIWILVWAGLGLVALGLVLRRLSRRRAGPNAP